MLNKILADSSVQARIALAIHLMNIATYEPNSAINTNTILEH